MHKILEINDEKGYTYIISANTDEIEINCEAVGLSLSRTIPRLYDVLDDEVLDIQDLDRVYSTIEELGDLADKSDLGLDNL